MRYTERRPNLYKSSQEIFGTCETVLDIIDKPTQDGDGEVLQFGQKQPEDNRKINWLWRCTGHLQIIATELIKGVHCTTRPEHFLKIIEHLEAMHEAGFVHGDIRAFNMVLNYEDENKLIGKLIDFDYEGKLSTDPKYPSGYVHRLKDGLRLGRPGAKITKSHDWYALGKIIFKMHDLFHPKITSKNQPDNVEIIEESHYWYDEQKRCKAVKECLRDMQEYFTDMDGNYEALQNGPDNFLRDYLKLAKVNGFELKLTKEFSECLEECNLLPQPGPLIKLLQISKDVEDLVHMTHSRRSTIK